MSQSTDLQHSYSVLVTEAGDDYTTEWIGQVRLIPQENGELYISIDFMSETAPDTNSARQSATNDHKLSIDSL